MSDARELLGAFYPPPVVHREAFCAYCGRSGTIAHPGRPNPQPADPGICYACALWAFLTLQADKDKGQP